MQARVGHGLGQGARRADGRAQAALDVVLGAADDQRRMAELAGVGDVVVALAGVGVREILLLGALMLPQRVG